MKQYFAVILALLKSREFWICAIAYPVAAISSKLVYRIVVGFATDHYTLYGTMSFLAATLLVLITIWEIVTRLLNHRIQGEHLKIRREKGIEVPDGIKERNIR